MLLYIHAYLCQCEPIGLHHRFHIVGYLYITDSNSLFQQETVHLSHKYLKRSLSDEESCGISDCAGIRSFMKVPYYNDVVHNEMISEFQIYRLRLYFINLYELASAMNSISSSS